MDEEQFVDKIEFRRIKDVLRKIRKLNDSDEVENYISLLEDELDTVENETKDLHRHYALIHTEVTNKYYRNYQFSDINGSLEIVTFTRFIENPFDVGLELNWFYNNNDESFKYEYYIKDKEKFSLFLLENSENLE